MAARSSNRAVMSRSSNSAMQSGSLLRGAPLDDECPYKRDTFASSMYGVRVVRTCCIARWMANQLEIGSLPLTTSPGMPNGAARSMTAAQPCCMQYSVEMPQPLFMTIIRMGSLLLGRVDQTRHEEKSPSAVPASPPTTMVMPSPPSRFCTMAVPGALTHWMPIHELTGTTFHSFLAQ